MREFAADNGMSETIKCTLFVAVQEADLWMSFSGESTKEQDHHRPDAHQVQAAMP